MENMRFKFRVWSNKQKKMYYWSDIIKIPNFGYALFVDNRALGEGLWFKQQSTDLKDKNGKLIFEGDILELYVSTKKAYRYQVKYEIGSFMLVSNDEIFDFRNKWNDNVYPLSQLYFEYENEEDCIYQCEVIGNIYENPELLEVE